MFRMWSGDKVMIKNSSAVSFASDVLSVKDRVLVYFWSESSDLCKTSWPILEEASNMLDRIDIVKVKSDNNAELLQELGVTDIPTVILFEDGKEKNRCGYVINKDSFLQSFGLN